MIRWSRMSRHPSWWMEMEWKTWRNQVDLHHQCHQTLVALIDTASVAMMSLIQHRGRLYATQFASRSVTGCRCRSGFLHTRESCNVNITRSVLSPAQSHSVAIVVISLLHWAVNTFIQESSIFYFVTYVIVESCDNYFFCVMLYKCSICHGPVSVKSWSLIEMDELFDLDFGTDVTTVILS